MNCPWTRYPWTFLLGSLILWILRPWYKSSRDRCVLTLDRRCINTTVTRRNLGFLGVPTDCGPHTRKPKLLSPHPTITPHCLYNPNPTCPNIMSAPTVRDTSFRDASSGRQKYLGSWNPKHKFRDKLIRDTSSCNIMSIRRDPQSQRRPDNQGDGQWQGLTAESKT